MLQTHIIYLQKSVPIQPKTSNILPKFCQPTLSDVSAGAEQPRVLALQKRPPAWGPLPVLLRSTPSDFFKLRGAGAMRWGYSSSPRNKDPDIICLYFKTLGMREDSDYNFRGLVLGCIEADFCKKIVHFAAFFIDIQELRTSASLQTRIVRKK